MVKRIPAIVGAIRTDLTMPSPDQRGGSRGVKSVYNFDALPVGACFAVIGRTATQLTTTITTANKKEYPVLDSKGKPVMEVVKDSAGKPVMTPDNKPQEVAKVAKRKFFAVDVDPATDPDKATARIWRES